MTRQPGGPQDARLARRTRWLVVGAVIVVLLSGVAMNRLLAGSGSQAAGPTGSPSASAPGSPQPPPSPAALPGADIKGPLTFLLAGVDTRVSKPGWRPNADAVLIMNVTRGLDRVYLTSLPRDLVVDIPAFSKSGFPGTRTKLTHAMSYGSKVPGSSKPDMGAGLELLAETVGKYTGIRRFDGAAVIQFGGLSRIVDALGGIDLYIDQRVVSQHRRPDGKHRAQNPRGEGYVGPQQVYEKGMRHLKGWQALDYARQRYTAGADYTRQRHHQQLIKAIIGKALSRDVLSDPDKVVTLLRTLGSAIHVDGRGRSPVDFVFALSRVKPESIVLVGLPGGSVIGGRGYVGERLSPVAKDFFAALRRQQLAGFLQSHPELINRER